MYLPACRPMYVFVSYKHAAFHFTRLTGVVWITCRLLLCFCSLSIFHSYCIEYRSLYGKNYFFLFNWSLFQLIGSYRIKKRSNARRWWASQWLCSPPLPAKMRGESGYIISCSATASQISSLQWRRPFFADSSLKPRSAVEMPQQLDWTSCSDHLADSVISCGYPVRSKKALLEEQISAQPCCKCRAVIVRRAGIPCTLMTLTLSVCHAWENARTASASVLPFCARG